LLPIDVKKKAENVLTIVWDDGHESVYGMVTLRKCCPCATCRTVRATRDTNPLKILSPKEIIVDDIQLLAAEVVGRYALQFSWSDGHSEGIYSFQYLRELCQCDRCKMEK